MGKLVRTRFDFEGVDDEGLGEEIDQDVKRVQEGKDLNFYTRASDDKGHNVKIQFTAPSYFLGFAEKLTTKYKIGTSDAHRSFYYWGCVLCTERLKHEGMDVSELETMLGWLQALERQQKFEAIKKGWSGALVTFFENLEYWGNNTRKIKIDIESMRSRIREIPAAEWKDKLSNDFEKKVKKFMDKLSGDSDE